MMITDEQHRQIGRILGFPECCVEAWIRDKGTLVDGQAVGTRRGCIEARSRRSPAECRVLDGHISTLLGYPWRGCASDPRVVYVPCPDHVV